MAAPAIHCSRLRWFDRLCLWHRPASPKALRPVNARAAPPHHPPPAHGCAHQWGTTNPAASYTPRRPQPPMGRPKTSLPPTSSGNQQAPPTCPSPTAAGPPFGCGGGGGGGVGVRVVVLRLGVVLSADGGALAKMLPVFQRYAGGAPGGGGCWFSWVSLADVVAVTLTAAAGTPPGASSAAAGSGAAGGPCRWSGVYNVVAPGVVTLASFCAALGAALGRPVWMPVPGGVMRALMGEAAMLVLAGQKVLPSRLSRRGYVWREGELGGGAMRKGDEGRKAAEEEGGAGALPAALEGTPAWLRARVGGAGGWRGV